MPLRLVPLFPLYRPLQFFSTTMASTLTKGIFSFPVDYPHYVYAHSPSFATLAPGLIPVPWSHNHTATYAIYKFASSPDRPFVLDALETRSADADLPLHRFKIATSGSGPAAQVSYSLTWQNTGEPLVRGIANPWVSNHVTLDPCKSSSPRDEADAYIVFHASSLFREIRKFVFEDRTYRWSIEDRNLVCDLQTITANGTKRRQAVAGIEIIADRKKGIPGIIAQLWVYHRMMDEVQDRVGFESMLVMTGCIMLEAIGKGIQSD